MHSIPESTSPERNIPSTAQTSPSHSSTELQSQQTNYENSDKTSKDDSAPGSECNDECLGFTKSYSTQLRAKGDKDKEMARTDQTDSTSTTSLYKKYKSDQIHFVNSNNNRKMSSPICSYYSECHKYLSEMIDKNVVDYSKSNNYIDKESILQHQKKLSFCENNNNTNNNLNANSNKNTPTTPNISSSYVYGYIPESFIPVFSYNTIHQKPNSATAYKNGSTVNETKTENENANDKTTSTIGNNGNTNSNSSTKNPETIGSKTPSVPNTQAPMNNKFGFPFSLGAHTPKLQYHSNFALSTQFMPFPIFIHKGMNPMTPIYGQSPSEAKPFPHFQLNNPNSSIIERKKHKQFTERPGDWVCAKCKNLNFAFRLTCNRCHLQKAESEKIGEVNQANSTSKGNPQPTSTNSNITNEDNSNTENSSTTNSNDTTNVDNTLTISTIETNGIQNYNSSYEVSSVQ